MIMWRIVLALVIITGCLFPGPGGQGDGFPAGTLNITKDLGSPAAFGYTYQQPDGNRFIPGRGGLPDAEPLDISLERTPVWLAAAPIDGGSIWAAVLDDGRVQAFEVAGGSARPVDITPDRLPPGMPPLLRVKEGIPSIVVPPVQEASTLTHPVILPGSGLMTFIEKGGDLVLWGDDGEKARFELDALPDARILVDDKERLLLLTGATKRYGHGILGDDIEASSITMVETSPEPRLVLAIDLPGDSVVEGLAPIWTDLDGDGEREIIVTVSDASQGARLAVFSEKGEETSSSSPIGTAFRWRHQLVAAPFGPTGETEIADILTPHLSKTVEFFRIGDGSLERTASLEGYTTHTIGSRNLDRAAAGDFDGDGKVELLVPRADFTELAGIARTRDRVEVDWTLPLDGKVTTNIGGVTLLDGPLAIGVGTDSEILRIWE